MGKVIVHATMSLDGFIAGSNDTPDNPLGVGGEQLHEWMFPTSGHQSKVNQRAIDAMYNNVGVIIMGKRMFDNGVRERESHPVSEQAAHYQKRARRWRPGGCSFAHRTASR